MANCVKCGADNKGHAKFCKSCGISTNGAPIAIDTCRACASPLPTGIRFCKKCGTPAVAISAASDPIAGATTASGVDAAAPMPPMPPIPDTSTFSTPAAQSAAEPDPSPQLPANASPRANIIVAVVGVAVILAVAGAATLFWRGNDKTSTAPAMVQNPPVPAATDAPLPAAPATPLVVKTDAPVEAIPDAPRPLAIEVKRAPEPATNPSPSVKPAQVAAKITRESQIQREAADRLSSKSTSLVVKAEGYLANRQYDKAIATAESALEIDSSNLAARNLIKRTKTQQLNALKSDSSLE